MLLRLIPAKTEIPFIKFRFLSMTVSGLFILGSLGLFFMSGLNYGIDFKGGTLLQITTEEPADLGNIRGTLNGLNLGEVQVQLFGTENDVLIRIETQDAEGDATAVERAQQDAVAVARTALSESIPNVTFARAEVVGPKVSGELVRASELAVVLAVLAVLIYIWFRFEWQFAVGAVMALVHDVILTIGVFSILQLEFNLSIIAALLTIVGYSLNDTVVVYDRIRENLRKYKRMALGELLDQSINDTLSRTVMTSVTTLLALIALYTFGGEVIRGFTFAMIWGVLVGTYSSIFVASPMLMFFGVRRDWSEDGGQAVTQTP